MAILVQTDETSGAQSALIAGVTTNDINILTGGIAFPSEFSTVLSAVTSGQGIPSVAALSGYGTATTTDDLIPVTFGANVSDVAFTLTGGNGVDSTLMTTNGTKIFLYVYSGDNNVVLGRLGNGNVADPNGAVAFAAYLDTQTAEANSDAGATGARLWLVQYQALKHPDGADANDVVTLSGLLNVQVNNILNFTLEGAPSGNNLFLMYGDGSPSLTDTVIVVTGKNPANQSGLDAASTADDISITTGDTVNTGQGGGGTTLGNSSQMLNPQKGLIFTFVTGANPDYVVPNLDQNEADLESNIAFTALVPSTGATFSVVQLQQDSLAELQISAFTTDLETGTGYVDGLGDADDVLVAINYIKVSTFTKQGQNLVAGPTHVFTASGSNAATGVTATFNNDGTVKLVGLEANDKIEYHTASAHMRVLIENTGDPVANASQTNAAFDIGGFRLTTGATTGTPLDALAFVDDGPTASAVLAAGTVAHDETTGVQADANDTTAAGVVALFTGVATLSTQMSAGYAQGSASVIDSSASSGGADGLASTAYSLAVSAAGVDSGLDTVGGQNILLYKEGDLVVGRISGGADDGKAAFAVAINSSTGVLSMAQYNAIKHPTGGASSPDESLSIANAALLAVATATDGDTDTHAASVAVGAAVSFQDDGPSLAFGNLVGTGTSDPQYGYWSRAAGADGVGATGLDISLTSFTLVRPDNTTSTGTTTFSELAGSPNGSGSYLFGGSLTGDFDNVAATPNQTVNFTMTAFANGTYQIDLAQGFASTTTTVSTIDGLTAGGPDPVQTLTPGAGAHPAAPLPDKQIVFFNVLATKGETDIESITGADPDLTEAQIEANAAFDSILGTEAMNVSTAGIGIGNNNLNGSDTSSTGLDESFVANPEFDVTKVKVFIDNSVSGYTPATESLYYSIFYKNGDMSAPVKVFAGDLVAGAKSNDPVHFVIQATGGRIIDAVRLTMDTGTIKIPFMEFITETTNLASDMQLDFQAILTDGDGDTASSNFEVNLFANELAGDFVLAGTSGADAFNIDLPDVKNVYQVNGFATGVDKLVLLGANSYTIDNSAADRSVVDITETAGGQHTLVTVMGVDLVAADIATLV